MVPLGLVLKMVIGNNVNFTKKMTQTLMKLRKKQKNINLIVNKKKHLNI
jgi:hypothetical protein